MAHGTRVLFACLCQGSGVMHAWFLAGICMQLEIRYIIDARAVSSFDLYTYSSTHTHIKQHDQLYSASGSLIYTRRNLNDSCNTLSPVIAHVRAVQLQMNMKHSCRALSSCSYTLTTRINNSQSLHLRSNRHSLLHTPPHCC